MKQCDVHFCERPARSAGAKLCQLHDEQKRCYPYWTPEQYEAELRKPCKLCGAKAPARRIETRYFTVPREHRCSQCTELDVSGVGCEAGCYRGRACISCYKRNPDPTFVVPY